MDERRFSSSDDAGSTPVGFFDFQSRDGCTPTQTEPWCGRPNACGPECARLRVGAI